jgi:hypothetical protein
MDQLNVPKCRLCMEDEETSFHVMAKFPALATIRHRTFEATHLNTPLDITVVVLFLRETFIG